MQAFRGLFGSDCLEPLTNTVRVGCFQVLPPPTFSIVMAQNQYPSYYNQQQYQQHPGYQQQSQQPQIQQSTIQQPNQRSFHRSQQQQLPYRQSFTPQSQSSFLQQRQQQQYAQSQSTFATPPSQQGQPNYTQQSAHPRSAIVLPPSVRSAHVPYSAAQSLQRQTSQTSFRQQPSTQTSTAQQAYYQAIAKQNRAPQSPIAYPNQQQHPQSAYNQNTSPTSRYSSYNQGQNQVHITRASSPSKAKPEVTLPSPVTPSGSGRPLPTPKSRPESMPPMPIAGQRSSPITNANQAQIPVRAPAPSSPTRPSVLNTPPGSISNSSFGSPPVVGPSTPSPTKVGGRPLPTPGGGTKHMSLDLGSGFRAESRSPSPDKSSATKAHTQSQPTSTSLIKPTIPFKSYRPAVPPPIRPEDLNLVMPSGKDSPSKFVPHWKKTLENLPPVVAAPVPPQRSTPSPPKIGVDAGGIGKPVSIQYSDSQPGSQVGSQPLPRSQPARSTSPASRPMSMHSQPPLPAQARAPPFTSPTIVGSGSRPLSMQWPPSQQPTYDHSQPPQSPSRPASRANSHVGLFNGAAPMGNRPPPPQHPLKKDVPPKPGMAFLSPSPKSRRAELPADDGYDRSTGGWRQEGEDSGEGEDYVSANEEEFEGASGVNYEQEHEQEGEEDWEVVSESERGYASEIIARRAAVAARQSASRTTSPLYGIRDLPHRRSQSPPKPALPPRSPEAPQQAQYDPVRSLTLHMAATSLSNANYSNAIPNRRSPSPTRQPSQLVNHPQLVNRLQFVNRLRPIGKANGSQGGCKLSGHEVSHSLRMLLSIRRRREK